MNESGACVFVVTANGHLCSGHYDGTIKVFKVDSNKLKCIRTFIGHMNHSISSLAALPDGCLGSASCGWNNENMGIKYFFCNG